MTITVDDISGSINDALAVDIIMVTRDFESRGFISIGTASALLADEWMPPLDMVDDPQGSGKPVERMRAGGAVNIIARAG